MQAAVDLREWFGQEPAGRGAVPQEARDAILAGRDESEAAAAELWRQMREAAQAAGREKDIAPLPPTLEEIEALAENERPQIRPAMTVNAGKTMPYHLLAKGRKPESGWPLVIALHGGGGTDRAAGPHDWDVNTREWQTQVAFFQRIYPGDALYLIPRMADDREGRWWYDHCQLAYDRLIRAALLFREVDPDRIHLIGISEGGYAALRLPANQPDRFASAGAMAAAEPLATAPPANLRNTPVRIDIGVGDTMFDRVGLARKYAAELDRLRQEDPGGYLHHLNVQAGRGHGIDYRECPVWTLGHRRNPRPERIVWQPRKLHQTLHRTNFWLVLEENAEPDPSLEIRAHADRSANRITLSARNGEAPASGLPLGLYLDDRLVDLDREVEVICNGQRVHLGIVPRRLGTLAESLALRGDPAQAYPARLSVRVP